MFQKICILEIELFDRFLNINQFFFKIQFPECITKLIFYTRTVKFELGSSKSTALCLIDW